MDNFFIVFHDVVAVLESSRYFYLLTYISTLKSTYVQDILSRDKPKVVGNFNYDLEFLSLFVSSPFTLCYIVMEPTLVSLTTTTHLSISELSFLLGIDYLHVTFGSQYKNLFHSPRSWLAHIFSTIWSV